MAGLGVLGWEKNTVPTEIQVLELNPHKFTDPATEVIHHPENEFVPVVVHGVLEFLPFVHGQISDDLAEPLIAFGGLRLAPVGTVARGVLFLESFHHIQ